MSGMCVSKIDIKPGCQREPVPSRVLMIASNSFLCTFPYPRRQNNFVAYIPIIPPDGLVDIFDFSHLPPFTPFSAANSPRGLQNPSASHLLTGGLRALLRVCRLQHSVPPQRVTHFCQTLVSNSQS